MRGLDGEWGVATLLCNVSGSKYEERRTATWLQPSQHQTVVPAVRPYLIDVTLLNRDVHGFGLGADEFASLMILVLRDEMFQHDGDLAA